MPLVESPTRVSLKNVLFATDFSEFSQAALPHALNLARHYGSKVYLAHVVQPEAVLSTTLEPLPAHCDREWVAAQERLASLGVSEGLKDVPHEVLLQRGDLWDVLANMVEKHDIDLIVVGTRGRGGVKKLLLGSVAEEIVRCAPCPVLTVGPEAKPPAGAGVRQILYATNFEPGSLHALAYALWLAQDYRARLAMLHVVEMPGEVGLDYVPPPRESLLRKLANLVPPGTELPCAPEFLAEFGAPSEFILHTALEKQADLIVMGARVAAHARASSHLAWDTAHRVLAHAQCPVLTVRG